MNTNIICRQCGKQLNDLHIIFLLDKQYYNKNEIKITNEQIMSKYNIDRLCCKKHIQTAIPNDNMMEYLKHIKFDKKKYKYYF